MLGEVKVQNPLAGFRWWRSSQLYTGHLVEDTVLFVPNEGDCVIDDNDVMWRVVAVDAVSRLSTLRIMDSSAAAQTIQGSTALARAAPYQQMLRAFLNQEVTPITLSLDGQWLVYGSSAEYIKVFRGANTSPDGEVISQMYDANGIFISENVPLIPIDPTNPNIKQPVEFNCNTALMDGETVTAVVYLLDGGIKEIRGFLIKNTNAIRGLGHNKVYIASIELVSGLLDSVIADTINAPAHTPIAGANFQAQLNYTDGTSELIAVGNNKCKLYGLDEFNPSNLGVSSEVALIYYLSGNESALNVSNQNVKAVHHAYKIRAVDSPIQYAFKVYLVPKYNPSTSRYTIDYYLGSLDRTIFVKLSSNNYTIAVVGGGGLDYRTFTNTQEFVITVNVGSVFPNEYAGFLFPQSVTIKFGIGQDIGWVIDYKNSSTLTLGVGVYSGYSALGERTFVVQSGQSSLTNWLNLLWKPVHAIFDPHVVLEPPTPTHMKLMYDGIESPWVLIATHWNITLPNYFGAEFIANDTMCIIWGILESDAVAIGRLGITPMPLRRIF